MKSIESKVWRNWQILLPYEICNEMKLKPGDFIRFVRRDTGVTLEKVEGWVGLKTRMQSIESEEITLNELQNHPLVKKFVEMPEEIYNSFSASNPTMKIVVDTLRSVMNLKP